MLPEPKGRRPGMMLKQPTLSPNRRGGGKVWKARQNRQVPKPSQRNRKKRHPITIARCVYLSALREGRTRIQEDNSTQNSTCTQHVASNQPDPPSRRQPPLDATDLVEPSQAKQALLLALAGFILVLPDPIPHSQSISLCPHSRTTTNDNNKRQQQTTATNDNNKQNPINPAQLDAKPSPAKHDRSQRPPPPDQSRAGVRGGRGVAATGCGPVSGLAWPGL